MEGLDAAASREHRPAGLSGLSQADAGSPRGIPAGILVVILALVANAWMLGLDFQYSDFDDIPDAGWLAGAEPAPGGMTWTAGVQSRVYSFRPVLWAVLFALREIAGRPAAPWIFHAFFLGVHAASCFLLCRIVAARVGALGGLVAGGLFAILPGDLHAVSWVTAGGDSLVVLFMLAAAVAIDRALRTGSGLAFAACAIAACCAVCSKETAVGLLPALLLVCAVPPAGATPSFLRRFWALAAAGAGAAAGWAFRAIGLGTWLPKYWIGASAPSFDAGLLVVALRGFLVPWRPELQGVGPPPFAISLLRAVGTADATAAAIHWAAVAAAVLLPIVSALIAGPARRRLALVSLAALVLLVILPLLPLLVPSGLLLSRAFYSAGMLLSALLACAAVTATRSARRLLLLAPFVVFSLDLFVAVARGEVRMAATIRSARADLDRLVAANAGHALVLLEPPAWVGNVPFLGGTFARAAVPPFARGQRAPSIWAGPSGLTRAPAITGIDLPVMAIAWDGARVAARGPLLPAIPAPLPALDRDAADPALFRPRAPVPPRAIAGVRIAGSGSGAAAPGRVTLRAGGHTLEVSFAAAGSGPWVVGVPLAAFDEDLAAEPAVTAIRVEGPTLAGAPELLRTLPAIALASPINDAWVGSDVPPRIEFSFDGVADAFRVTLTAIVESQWIDLAWSATPDAPTPGSRQTIMLDREAAVTVDGKPTGGLAWATIAATLAERAPGELFAVGLVVEALDASRTNVIGRSTWRRIMLVRRRSS